ncbi:uncharacterized protein N7482_000720 [Penicillium canariense]|uniref:Uncharacterized protein n=1 Tax=Penicillium canariense TaxID=189055 RepID=A0A9W9LS89_9EURO|nr:uncharacterized protein N7482_000720 [Penicillium canariense]KAJ5174843.1 hypothetical protein N7482_000720 [Penicillium canariense]
MNSGDIQSVAFQFHLFGDLWLEDPKNFHNEIDLSEITQYLALIEALDKRWEHRPRISWNLDSAFAKFVERETATWSKQGVERPSHDLLPPSGSIESSLACHLMNPTYYVANPEDRITDDPSSPTMELLHNSGFSSQNALIFDQVCRTGRTEDMIEFYTDEFYQPHRDFVREIRGNMAAIVEICWGNTVWKEMKRELGPRLVRYLLWGVFKPVRLYLELDESHRSLKRFILHVRHPEFFVRSGLAKLGLEARKIYGEAQDLALTVARRLVGDGKDFTVNCFPCLPSLQVNRLTRKQENLRDKNDQLALKAFEAAFPETYQRRVRRKEESEEIKSVTSRFDSVSKTDDEVRKGRSSAG